LFAIEKKIILNGPLFIVKSGPFFNWGSLSQNLPDLVTVMQLSGHEHRTISLL
jgi:hypothetical protein